MRFFIKGSSFGVISMFSSTSSSIWSFHCVSIKLVIIESYWLSSFASPSRTVLRVVRKCIFVEFFGCSNLWGWCIHAPMCFFGKELCLSLMIFPMYHQVFHVMKVSIVGMLGKILLMSLVDIFSSCTLFILIPRMQCLSEWWKALSFSCLAYGCRKDHCFHFWFCFIVFDFMLLVNK